MLIEKYKTRWIESLLYCIIIIIIISYILLNIRIYPVENVLSDTYIS
jgi:hypothetical protein